MTEKDPSLAEITAANRDAWDASARLHQDGFQTSLAKASQPGYSELDACLTETLQALSPKGKRAVQICCNNGREILSLKALGAVPVLGIDQSRAFLDQAEQLARAMGSDCQFLCADIYDLPAETPRDLDLALITIGVFGWMPDLTRFFAVVADLLAPGGQLVIYETHPMLEMFDPASTQPFTPSISYFQDGPDIDDVAITYDGPTGEKAGISYWYVHTMGAIVTAAIKAGLTIERLTEHPHSNRETEFDIYEGRDAQVPMSFTLVARNVN